MASPRKAPDSLIIVSVILLITWLLCFIVPAGEFQRQALGTRTVVVPGTFQFLAEHAFSVWSVFTAPIHGFEKAAEIIAFVLLVGGAFGLINATGAIDAGLQKAVVFAEKKSGYRKFVVALLITLFSIGGCTFGMSEEVLVFILLTIPLAHKLGYDTITGVAIPFVGAGVGFAGAAFNPFTIGIAQGIAELQPFSGWEYRMLIWTVFTSITIIFILKHAEGFRHKAIASGASQTNAFTGKTELVELSTSRVVILLAFMAAIVLLVIGANKWDWYIAEIAGLFVSLGVLAAILGKLSVEISLKSFIGGCKDLLHAALIIALSRAILVLAEEGKIIDTVLYYVSGSLNELPKAVALEGMFVVQSAINFFVPSGSGQAALTMPIMTPLSDLLEIKRQTAVLAYQFGDGLSNMVIPTSGVSMGILSLAEIPYNTWLKWFGKFFILLNVLAMAFLAVAHFVDVW